jgi:hypothetical protein
MQQAVTRSISIAARPQVVMDLVGDPLELPRWAPVFARRIQPDGGNWIVASAAGELRINVRVSREHGTVDFLAAGTPAGVDVGAFSRVMTNGDGAEYMFTRFFAGDADEHVIAEQMAVVEEELRTVKAVCESEGRLG